ncbi:MAG: hypothetical protein HY321_13165 [Armatimonadetes bacterium]|nr:hypothetical protein [Armatimonadota bacterium]
MRYIVPALVGVALLLSASRAFATPFTPLPSARSVDEVTPEPGKKLSVGVAVASWGREDLPEDANYVGVQFNSKVKPMAMVDYQVTDQIAIGGWYNPLSWDVDYRWDQTPGPGGGAAPGLYRTFEGDGNMFEVHSTMALPSDFAVQLAYQNMNVDWTRTSMYNPSTGQMDATSNAAGSDKATKVVLWGTKTFRLGNPDTKPLGLILGVGVAKGLSGQYDSRRDNTGNSVEAKDTTVNGLIGGSYAISPMISADASLWMADWSREEERSLRLTLGATGRF